MVRLRRVCIRVLQFVGEGGQVLRDDPRSPDETVSVWLHVNLSRGNGSHQNNVVLSASACR